MTPYCRTSLRRTRYFFYEDEPNKLYEIVPPYAARESSRSAGSRGHALYSQLAADLRLMYSGRMRIAFGCSQRPRAEYGQYLCTSHTAELNCGAKVNIEGAFTENLHCAAEARPATEN
ncbi:hypothetical protein EVAR_87940_1 [Eumeta japonica]|uniref:Uncharacterized protein n=1 Tax=Eumeta variegata TaxID=151549 RepID=A0A4C1SYI7_EUMVA|nr:hypothetical protein EVAR_87940_1 [Eumeta japonica]